MLKIRYGKHARFRMVERGISDKEIRTAIIKGTKRIQNGKIVSSYLYFEVVYKKIKDEIYVITVKPRW
ncbi:MAG: DUF4258 domain-containing protein [Methanocellales archaeon]|nr:DUF4258 domain-containing protein [Methanocellales archaeon]MDI6859174.1 DUF4258 domain-containing protein [Methanocellales archaeon]MDI6902406.1 DUF4258 domain-containing protein [Methanocellales archaeon]